jgi:SAM-dependent methyltransferase
MNQDRSNNLLKIVRENYETIAQDFNATRKKVLWPDLVDLAKEVKVGDSVLDAGCGNGRLLQVFEGKKIKYLGTDQSEGLIELAKHNTIEFGQGIECEFLVADILDLKEKVPGQFDWIFSIAVIHHLPGLDLQLRALENVKAKLRPGGKMVISVWRPWGNKNLVRQLWRTIGCKLIGRHPYGWNDLIFNWHNSQSPRYYHFFTKSELRRLIRMSGLELVEWRTEKRNYYLVLK